MLDSKLQRWKRPSRLLPMKSTKVSLCDGMGVHQGPWHGWFAYMWRYNWCGGTFVPKFMVKTYSTVESPGTGFGSPNVKNLKAIRPWMHLLPILSAASSWKQGYKTKSFTMQQSCFDLQISHLWILFTTATFQKEKATPWSDTTRLCKYFP